MKPSADQLNALRQMARHNPQVVEFLNEWRQAELESLPFATNNLDVCRGRVQTLTELQRFLAT